MRFVRDGNLAPWLRAVIWIAGFVILLASVAFAEGMLLYWGALTGLVIAAIGGYAEKANALHLKPFDRSYARARKSYEAAKAESQDPGSYD